MRHLLTQPQPQLTYDPSSACVRCCTSCSYKVRVTHLRGAGPGHVRAISACMRCSSAGVCCWPSRYNNVRGGLHLIDADDVRSIDAAYAAVPAVATTCALPAAAVQMYMACATSSAAETMCAAPAYAMQAPLAQEVPTEAGIAAPSRRGRH